MDQIHQTLTTNSQTYAEWHQHPAHKKLHWLLFVVFASLVALSLVRYIQVASAIGMPATSVAQTSPVSNPEKEVVTLTQQILTLAHVYDKASAEQKAVLLPQLEQLIQQRKAALLSFAKQAPRRIGMYALPDGIRKKLPDSLQALLEKKVSIKGKPGFKITDYADQRRADAQFSITEQGTGRVYQLILQDGQMLPTSSTVTVEGSAIDTQVAVSSLTTTQQAAPAAVNHHMAVVLVNFQNQTPGQTNSEMNTRIFTGPESTAAYYTEQSFGKETFYGDVFGWYNIPYDNATADSCTQYTTYASSAANQAAAAGVNLSAYDIVMYLIPNQHHGCTISGIASGSGTSGTAYIFGSSFDKSPDRVTIDHELGHVISLGHSGTVSCASLQITAPSNCEYYEYGDFFSVMGGHTIPQTSLPPQYHMAAPQKVGKGWITGSNIQTVSASGTYTIYPIETQGSGLQVLKIDRPANGDSIYVSYRQPSGFDASLPSMLSNVHVYTGYPYAKYTSLLYNIGPWSNGLNQVLSDGATISDVSTGVTIKQVSHNSTSATVEVTIPPAVCTKGTPTISATPTTGISTNGAPVLYTLSLGNTDSNGCASTSFGLSSTLPGGWSSSFSSNTVQLAPGASTTVTVYVTPVSPAVAGTYPVTMTMTDTGDATHKASTTGITQQVTVSTASDTTAPTVSITSPTNGALVSGGATTVVAASASDNISVTRTDIYVGSTLLCSDTSAPYSCFWNVPKGKNKTYTLSAKAYDAVGNVGTAASVTVKSK